MSREKTVFEVRIFLTVDDGPDTVRRIVDVDRFRCDSPAEVNGHVSRSATTLLSAVWPGPAAYVPAAQSARSIRLEYEVERKVVKLYG